MPRPVRISPTPGFRPSTTTIRILPRADFKPSTLHTRALPPGSSVQAVDAEWCPICFGRKISERLVSGQPVWHCDACSHEW